MTKHEVKVEITEKDSILSMINKAYPKSMKGRINGNENFMEIYSTSDSFSVFKGLNGSTAKISNQEIIDGTIRVMVREEKGIVKLYPISIYCIDDEQGRYIFY
jgi:hypothetical protein